MLHCVIKNIKCYFVYDEHYFILIEFLNTGIIKIHYKVKLKLVET